MSVRFDRPPGWKSLQEATLARELMRRFRRGEHPTEWEIGDAINQLGLSARGSIVEHLLSQAAPRNREGVRYTRERLDVIAKIADWFPEAEMRVVPVSFSHYEELWKRRVALGVCGLCLDLAKHSGRDHKFMRDKILPDVRRNAVTGSDGVTRVAPMPRWGLLEEMEIRERRDPVQLGLTL